VVEHSLHDGTKGDDVGDVGEEDEDGGGKRLTESSAEEVREVGRVPGQLGPREKDLK
jgi:hypothetical protein